MKKARSRCLIRGWSKFDGMNYIPRVTFLRKQGELLWAGRTLPELTTDPFASLKVNAEL